MGNQLTQPSRLAAAEAVADLGGSVTYKDSLGGVPPLAAAAATAAAAAATAAVATPVAAAASVTDADALALPPAPGCLPALQVGDASSRARCVCTMKAAWWWSRCAAAHLQQGLRQEVLPAVGLPTQPLVQQPCCALPPCPWLPCPSLQVYAKRVGAGGDSQDVRPYKERLLEVRARLAGLEHPHVWPVQRIYESDRAVFLVRQFMHANLAQRVTTRPFLTLIEKVRRQSAAAAAAAKGGVLQRCAVQSSTCPTDASPLRPCAPLPQRWIAYQLLLALAQCHERGVCHGDIKPENAALSSWDWAYLVDFAPFKPTLLPADNPADFSFFFDTSGRRKCYLAPERFYDPAAAGITPQQAATAPLTPAMVRGLL